MAAKKGGQKVNSIIEVIYEEEQPLHSFHSEATIVQPAQGCNAKAQPSAPARPKYLISRLPVSAKERY
jgi:hypothetical protein